MIPESRGENFLTDRVPAGLVVQIFVAFHASVGACRVKKKIGTMYIS